MKQANEIPQVWPMLLARYRAGQITEQQWQQHLQDAAFARWVATQ